MEQLLDVEHGLQHALLTLFVVALYGLLLHLICNLPLLVREIRLNFKLELPHVLRKWVQYDVRLLCEDGFGRLLVGLYFNQLTSVFDFRLESEQLFKRMVEKHDFFCRFVRQDFTNFFKAFGTLEQRDKENLHVVVGPNVALLVLHLVL